MTILPKSKNAVGFAIESFVMLDGWKNTFKNKDGTPYVLTTREEAEEELKAMLKNVQYPIELRVNEALSEAK